MRNALVLLLLLNPQSAVADLLFGRVTDGDSGKPLPGTTVAVLGTAIGTLTGTDGYYRLKLPSGTHKVHFSFVGYATFTQSVYLDVKQQLSVALQPEAIALSEITVTPGRFAIMGDAPGSHQTLSEEEIQSIPQLGEDIFRAVTRLPGISSNDFSARFAVRGGDPEHVLVRVDGVELYDPFHLKDIGGGALSIVDIALIENIDLLTGGFPAEYGDRLSGVFDIRTRTPRPGTRRGCLGLSMTNARALAEGASERSTWLMSARRGYVDLVLNLMGEDENFRPRYNDVFGKYTNRLSEHHKLQASILRSHDELEFIESKRKRSDTRYANTYTWITLASTLKPVVQVRTTLLAGRISDRRDGQATWHPRSNRNAFRIRDERRFNFAAINQNWTFELSTRHFFKWGFDLRRLNAFYDYSSEQRLFFRDGSGVQQARLDTTTVALEPRRYTAGLYAADRLRLNDLLALELGLRWDCAGHTDDRHLSPRVNLVYTPARRTSLRASWGRFYQSQGIHELQVQDGEQRYHRAELAVHRVVGLEHFFINDVRLRLEAYSKNLSSLRPKYRNWSNNIAIFPEIQGDRLRIDLTGARTRGLEIYLKRDSGGRFTWWLSYALARVDESIHSLGTVDGTTPFAREVPGRFDQRHSFNLDLNYRPSPHWRLSAAWQYRSGWPFTDRQLRHDTVRGEPIFYDQLDELNSSIYPPFHRLDLRLNRTINTAAGRIRAFLEITNVYNHGNVRNYLYGFTCSSEAASSCRYRKVPEFWFKLLPSAGLSWSWDL